MTSRVSDYDRSNMANIMAGHGDWFAAQLFRLIAKADSENLARLRLAFPDHVEAFEDWRRRPSDNTRLNAALQGSVPRDIED